MAGPALDPVQLQAQVDWLKDTGPVSFQNFRYSGGLQKQTDSGGSFWVFFEPAFTTELLGFSCSLDLSGGARRWILGFQSLATWGLVVTVWDPFDLTLIANTTVGFYYIAVGR